jgi:hypothetical protein
VSPVLSLCCLFHIFLSKNTHCGRRKEKRVRMFGVKHENCRYVCCHAPAPH